jgi:hypothetical protein
MSKKNHYLTDLSFYRNESIGNDVYFLAIT